MLVLLYPGVKECQGSGFLGLRENLWEIPRFGVVSERMQGSRLKIWGITTKNTKEPTLRPCKNIMDYV